LVVWTHQPSRTPLVEDRPLFATLRAAFFDVLVIALIFF
jgi:hypothetical protein